MQVEVLEATDNPDRLACRAARGDYYDGFVAEDSYSEVMDGVSYDDRDMEVVEQYADDWACADEHTELEAKTVALLRKTLKRGHFGEK